MHMLPSDQIREVVSRALEDAKVGARRLEKQYGLQPWSLKGILDPARKQSPSVGRAAEICDALDLEFYIGPPRAQESTAVPESCPYDSALDDAEHVMVPKLSVQLAAGHGAATPEVETATGFLAFRREWMQHYGLQPGQVSAVDVTGDSMEPMLSEGDTVLVDHRRNEAKQGKVFAVRVEDDLLVKRLQRQPDGGWLLTSDNESYEPVSMVHHAALIGEVVWRGTWLGEPMASKKQVADILRLFEIMARRRVETGEAESFDQAIADIEEEMRQEGVLGED